MDILIIFALISCFVGAGACFACGLDDRTSPMWLLFALILLILGACFGAIHDGMLKASVIASMGGTAI